MHTDTVDRVSRRFVRYLETGAESDAVFTEDVFLDFTLPLWRLQAQGLADVHAVRLRGHPATGTVSRWSAHPTPGGFAMEAEERWRDAKSDWYCREAFFAELRGDRIARLSVYCTGDWDRERQAAHAGQVALLQP